MKRLSTILVLLCAANGLFAQRAKKNAAQSYLSVDIGVPIYNTTFAKFPIPLAIEWQRKKKRLGFGASVALEYDKNSRGDCANRNITTGQIIGFQGIVPYPYVPYCETLQYLNLKPTIFGCYYFVQKKHFNCFAKLGSIANIPVLLHQEGEFYEIEALQNIINPAKVKDAGPIHISRNIPSYQTKQIGLLSGLGGNYFLNKRTALRFTLQSELYRNYWDNGADLLFFALCGITFKI
jgi:hypothetical protein